MKAEDDDDIKRSTQAYAQLYEFQSHPPECFVAQIAYTQLNGFLLTTDGRVYSWGGLTHSIGRDHSLGVGQILFSESAPIAKLATGKSHVLALDTKGRVYLWGKNEYG